MYAVSLFGSVLQGSKDEESEVKELAGKNNTRVSFCVSHPIPTEASEDITDHISHLYAWRMKLHPSMDNDANGNHSWVAHAESRASPNSVPPPLYQRSHRAGSERDAAEDGGNVYGPNVPVQD